MTHRSGHAHPHHHPHHHHHKPSLSRREFIASLIAAGMLSPSAFAMSLSDSPADMAATFRKMSEEYEAKGLAEPFQGITTNGQIVPDLFQISPTGVSTEAVRNAAEKFIATLSNVQLARTLFTVDDVQWRKWMNQHFYVRAGISFQEMTAEQRDAAFALMRASFSVKGFELTRNIMRLNETLAELSGDSVFLGEWLSYRSTHSSVRSRSPSKTVGLPFSVKEMVRCIKAIYSHAGSGAVTGNRLLLPTSPVWGAGQKPSREVECGTGSNTF